MGIVIVIMWFGISGICIFLGSQIDNLKSTIKRQQKQIDCLNNHINSDTQDRINIDIIDICKDIANKVISIEEKVDSDSERIKTLEMETRVINYKNSITS